MFEFKDVGYLTNGEIDLILDKKIPETIDRFHAPSYHFKIKKHLTPIEIGRIDIRIGYNETTFYGGNIGYEIFPPYRGHHYAAQACVLITKVAKIHNLAYLYISCLPENIPSNKTCQKLNTSFLGTFHVPFHNELYLVGVRTINIYAWQLF
ncbi:MAG: GNAT family N-acetyltransferase [Turicibacter sp.]